MKSMRFYLSLVLAAPLTLLAIGAAAVGAEPIASELVHWAIDGHGPLLSGVLVLALLLGSILLMLAAIALFFSLWRVLFMLFGGRVTIDPSALLRSPIGAQESDRVAAHRVREAKAPYWATGKGENRGTLSAFIKGHQEFLAEKDLPHTAATELRIGIVLAGGGAKGAYQAGALRALWEFLAEQQALQYVRAIAGTSIGSWNAVFWTTGNVANGELRRWWVGSRTSRIVGPAWYIPIVRNFFATSDPWRKDFRDRFSGVTLPTFPHCYFTRTNVEGPELEITTDRKPRPNRQDYRDLSNDDTRFTRPIDASELEAAVFASMDLPPLFARIRGGQGQRYEDGGVIDNLPIRYATWFEGCNLMFVLPLNSTFRQQPSERSILARLVRVADIRQGVLERDALTEIGLYNYIVRAAPNMMPAGMPRVQALLRLAATPQPIHTKTVTTFCICPDHPLAVDTVQFWKLPGDAVRCEELMYQATREQLRMFDFSPSNQQVWMATVPPAGDVSYTDFTPQT